MLLAFPDLEVFQTSWIQFCVVEFEIVLSLQIFKKMSEADQFFGWITLRKCSTKMDSVLPEKSRKMQPH